MKKLIKNGSAVNNCWNTHGVWSGVDQKCARLVEYIHCRNCPVFSIEGKRVLDRAAPVGYLKEWRNTLAAKKKAQTIDNQSALIFRVCDEWFALPAWCLQEITEKRAIHRIPRNVNTDISGVVNVGGEVRICYSLVSILGIKALPKGGKKDEVVVSGRFIVTTFGKQNFVFFVDQISGLSNYNSDDVFPVPATLNYGAGNMLLGVINHNKNKVAVLNADLFQRNLEEIRL